MAENRIETKILLRYATYSQWMSSDLILLPGEAAIAAFTRINTLNNTDDVPSNTPPAIGIKIGDGIHYFDELPWVQAIAADVYNWAKAPQKPSYSANEISGLEEFITNHGGGGSGGGSGSISSAYRIVYDENTQKYILQSYDEQQQMWVNTSSEINLSQILARINTIERWANGARTNLGNIEVPIAEYIYEEVINYINRLDYDDIAQPHQFITSVTETNGIIAVTRASITAADITGVLNTSQGGTGLTQVEEDELLIGSVSGTIQPRRFVTHIEETERNVFATSGAIIDYVLSKTAGLTGAMHFIGEATVVINNNSHVDPAILGYNFSNASPGDVILSNYQEFVWTGDSWRLLGDEGSYAIKGSITDVDIAADAAIQQSKIANLDVSLNSKVDKIEGKTLSSNDFTDELKNKLEAIEDNAQRNTIEHILINGEEVTPSTINSTPNSVNLEIDYFDETAQNKLNNIESGAQVNVIEKIIYNNEELIPENKIVTITPDPHTEHINKIEQIFVNGVEQTPNANKQVNITIEDSAAIEPVTTEIRQVVHWGPGRAANMLVENNILHLTTGIAPQLDTLMQVVVTDIQKEGT